MLLHSPTYIGFTGALNNNGYHIVHSPLRKDEQNIWRMDFEDMEKKIAENHIHAAIFCSPPQSRRTGLGKMGNRKGHGAVSSDTTCM